MCPSTGVTGTRMARYLLSTAGRWQFWFFLVYSLTRVKLGKQFRNKGFVK